MLTTLLFPTIAQLHVEAALRHADQIVVFARRTGRTARCPRCRRRSRHLHSHYERRLADLPCSGSPLTISLRIRRFVCTTHRCPQHIFSERMPALAAPHARRTVRAQEHLLACGLQHGGQPGALQATRDGIPVSRRTLLRLVRAAPLPVVGTVRVLGVDDFSLRKGRTYATILVDLDTHRPLDILPGRTAETFAAWLAQHPGSAVISRDRASAYADGARIGAPHALQVADRFHILENLHGAVERYLSRNHHLLRSAAQEVQAERAALHPPPDELAPPANERPLTASATYRADRRARRYAQYQEVCALYHSGVGQREIARCLGIGRAQVHRFVHAAGFPEQAPRSRRRTLLRPYEASLRQRWEEGCHNARLLYEQIRAQGYTGAAVRVRQFVAQWRAVPGRPGPTPRTQTPGPIIPMPVAARSPQQASWLLVRPREHLTAEEGAYVLALLRLSPEAALLQTLAQRFHQVLLDHDLAGLQQWILDVEAHSIPELIGFARGVRRDSAAVEAAVCTDWSQGQVEGTVNKIKLLERSMFGRAKLDLLRQRLLLGV